MRSGRASFFGNAVRAKGRFGPCAQLNMQLVFPGPDNLFGAFFASEFFGFGVVKEIAAVVTHAYRGLVRTKPSQYGAELHFRCPCPCSFATIMLAGDLPG